MDKPFQVQKPLLVDQLFDSTKGLIIENLELAAIATTEPMRTYYEGIALGAYCLFSAHSPLASANTQPYWLCNRPRGERMTTYSSPRAPVVQQDEGLSIATEVVLAEYHQVFKNQDAHFAEVALRYLIWLIASDSPAKNIKGFANQMRLELNNKRLHRIKDAYAKRVNEQSR